MCKISEWFKKLFKKKKPGPEIKAGEDIKIKEGKG